MWTQLLAQKMMLWMLLVVLVLMLEQLQAMKKVVDKLMMAQELLWGQLQAKLKVPELMWDQLQAKLKVLEKMTKVQNRCFISVVTLFVPSGFYFCTKLLPFKDSINMQLPFDWGKVEYYYTVVSQMFYE